VIVVGLFIAAAVVVAAVDFTLADKDSDNLITMPMSTYAFLFVCSSLKSINHASIVQQPLSSGQQLNTMHRPHNALAEQPHDTNKTTYNYHITTQ
jgi:hypothetical protein